MSKLSDKEIQELLDQGKFSKTIENPGQEGFVAYQTLFEELDIPPEVTLPYGFANQVISRFERNKSAGSKRRICLYTAVAAIIGLAGGGLILTELIGNDADDLYQWLLSYKEIILFVLIVIVLIQLLDEKFVKSNRPFIQ